MSVPMHIPAEPVLGVSASLFAILLLVLVLPFKVRFVEENLEPFFLVMGLIATATVFAAGILDHEGLKELFKLALKSPVSISGKPIGITQVVFLAGLVFYLFHRQIHGGVSSLFNRIGPALFGFVLITLLGLCSSIISVIVAAVILAEIVDLTPLGRREKIEFAVIAAFAVGLGAALTPVGEPLSTIAISKLSGPPYHAGFMFLLKILGHLIIPGVIALGIYGALRLKKHYEVIKEEERGLAEAARQSFIGVVERTIRVYVFVMALELLGTSFTPLIYWYLSKVPAWVLYWMNTVSAILDNATLTAAEIGPALTLAQIKSALISLLISGGMLIPGNIPNIVLAGRLKISSREWARIGVPIGAVMLVIYFVLVEVIKL